MPTLTWKDSRLPAYDIAPYDTTVMFTGPSQTVDELISDSVAWCETQSANQGGSLNLMIYCHGASGYLQICREGIKLSNAGKLAPLKPYFDTVSIHACEVAKGQSGRAFCTRLAHVLASWVAAAVKVQINTGPQTLYGLLDDKKYDGEYYMFLPSGERQGPLTSA